MELKELLLRKEKKWRKRYFNKGFKEKFKLILKNSKRHLEFGCGFGFLAYLLAKDYPKTKIIGIDIDKKIIQLGKKRYKRKNLQLKCTGKITGKFDSVSAVYSVHHAKNKYLKDFYDHLNQNGKILIFDFRKVSKKEFKKWHKKKIAIGEYKDPFDISYREHNKFTVKQFKKTMEKIGFKTIESIEAGDFWLWYIGKK